MLLETSLTESHLDNSAVPNCPKDYVEGNECSLSLSSCGSLDNDCAVLVEPIQSLFPKLQAI